MTENPTEFINKKSFPMLLNEAFTAINKPSLLKKAFESTGVWPTNPYALPRDLFAPSEYLQQQSRQFDTSSLPQQPSSNQQQLEAELGEEFMRDLEESGPSTANDLPRQPSLNQQ